MPDVNHPNDTTSREPLIVIVSNRGPFSFRHNERGELEAKRGAGGLVTALAALAEKHEVLWIAAALGKGDSEWAKQHGNQPQRVGNTLIQMFRPNPKRYRQYYNKIANPLLWFIQHQLWDTPRYPNIDQEMWEAWREGYVAVNRQAAQVVAESVQAVRAATPERPVYIFPQDYHLYLVPRFLRELLGTDVHIQPFLHIPWPGPDAWRLLPSEIRDDILHSMLMSDRIGFQTEKDAFNFVQTTRFYLDEAHSDGARDRVEYRGRIVHASSYPISVDVEKLNTIVNEPQTKLLKAQLINLSADQKRIVRVDRIEPSKNILRGFQAFGELLERHPEHRGRVQMIALLVPSRLEVAEYKTYWQEVMMVAGMINAKYNDPLWEPVRIIVGDNYHRAMAALQIYDILLVNPIADGMNLVAKEGSYVNQKDGVLILSEYAGAFYELGENALIVSPFDIYGTAESMHHALTMSPDEKKKRAEALKTQVQNANVHQWFYRQLEDANCDFTERAAASHSKKASTPSTPSTVTSEFSKTTGAVEDETTPIATA